MSNRIRSLIVVLEKDMREDDAERLIEAIQMIKGVLSVSNNIHNSADFAAEQRIKSELRSKIHTFFKELDL